MKNKQLIISILLLLTGAGIFYWYQNRSTQDEVITSQPEYRDLVQTLEVSGSILAHEHVKLAFPATSQLTWVGVKEGDQVKKWQAVAKVDTRQLEKQLQQDLNTFGSTFRTHDDVLDETNYYGDQGISTEVRRLIERSNLGLDSAALQVEIRDISIRLSTLTSPISGLVTRVDKPFAGVNTTPQDQIEIVNPESMYFSILVDEEDISLIREAQTVKLQIDAYIDEILTGTTKRIAFSPSIRDQTRVSYEVIIESADLSLANKYRLGMQGLAEIILSSADNVLSVPIETLIFRDGETFVEVMTADGSVETRTVTIGIESTDYVQILDGLNESDQIVVPQRS